MVLKKTFLCTPTAFLFGAEIHVAEMRQASKISLRSLPFWTHFCLHFLYLKIAVTYPLSSKHLWTKQCEQKSNKISPNFLKKLSKKPK
jgi:hypothetical protein